MIDVSALIGDIPTTTITVRTSGAPTINRFGEVSSSTSDTSVTAVVHPADKRTRERLTARDAARESIAIYLVTADAVDTVRTAVAPRVQYQGRWYEVVGVADYTALGGVCMAVADLIDETA